MEEKSSKPLPLNLESHQLQLLAILREKQSPEYRLRDWYYGAIYALADTANPDRISQAAHSLREMVEKLPKWTGVTMTEVNITA